MISCVRVFLGLFLLPPSMSCLDKEDRSARSSLDLTDIRDDLQRSRLTRATSLTAALSLSHSDTVSFSHMQTCT